LKEFSSSWAIFCLYAKTILRAFTTSLWLPFSILLSFPEIVATSKVDTINLSQLNDLSITLFCYAFGLLLYKKFPKSEEFKVCSLRSRYEYAVETA